MNYFEISNESIFNNKNLLKEFLLYYSKITGEINLNANCVKCIDDYKNKLINIMNTKEKLYLLNEKYEGLFFENDHITNENITEKIALKIIEKYVNQENRIDEIFAKYPIKDLNKKNIEK